MLIEEVEELGSEVAQKIALCRIYLSHGFFELAIFCGLITGLCGLGMFNDDFIDHLLGKTIFAIIPSSA